MPATIVSLDLTFRDSNHLRTEGHSFANQINVVHAELQLLERMSEPHEDLRPAIRLCEVASRAFKSQAVAQRHGEELQGLRRRVQAITGTIIPRSQYALDAKEAVQIIGEALDDVNLRVHETLARYQVPHVREKYSAGSLTAAVEEHLGPGSRATVKAGGALFVPPELPEALGRLGRAIGDLGAGPIDLAAEGDSTGGSDRILINSQKVGMDLVPSTFPQSIARKSDLEKARALIAWIAYLVSPGGIVSVNPDGKPLLAVSMTN